MTLSFTLGGGDLTREYRLADGLLERAATNVEENSRTRMLLTLLRLSGRVDAGWCFDAATRAASFDLRWAGMREWLALDANRALPRLREMAAHDRHPEVTAAARATLPLVEAAICPA